MSRKILKIGTDLLTLNDKLVSVKEDYPFWKVNLDTSEQYFNKLKKDLSTPPDVELMMTPHEVTTSNSFGTVNGMIACSNGSVYTIPNAATSIVKITPNLADPTNPTITNIGTFSATANKFVGGHEVGGKLYLMPSSFESIAIIDLFDNDALSFTGSLGTTANKFGKSSLADNGLIIAPANVSTQHLIFNPETLVITLQTAVTFNGVLQNKRRLSVNMGGNMVYMSSDAGAGTGSNRLTKINMDTLVEEGVLTSTSFETGVSIGFGHDGSLYLYNSSISSWIVFNTNNADSRVQFAISTVSNVSYNNGAIGSDGWVYCFHNNVATNYVHFRINPLNNTIQYSSALNNNLIKVYCSCMGIDGNLYGVNTGNKINVYDFNSTVDIVPNRIYSRYNIR